MSTGKNDLARMRRTIITQMVEFDIDGVSECVPEELASPVADFIDYLNKLPWSGRLVIHMAFIGGHPPPQ